MTPLTHIIRTTSLTFDFTLHKHQIPLFRKKVWKWVGMEKDIFHNHRLEEGEIGGGVVRYPLIQYRTSGRGLANIWAMNEGVDAALLEVLKPGFFPLVEMPVVREFQLQRLEVPALYKLFGYVPFDKKNHQAYMQCATMVERVALLERLITNQIVLFCYAAGWQITHEQAIQVQLHDITHVGKAVYQPAGKAAPLSFIAFDLSFYANMRLPDQIGLGNLKGLGYGLLKQWEEINAPR